MKELPDKEESEMEEEARSVNLILYHACTCSLQYTTSPVHFAAK